MSNKDEVKVRKSLYKQINQFAEDIEKSLEEIEDTNIEQIRALQRESIEFRVDMIKKTVKNLEEQEVT